MEGAETLNELFFWAFWILILVIGLVLARESRISSQEQQTDQVQAPPKPMFKPKPQEKEASKRAGTKGAAQTNGATGSPAKFIARATVDDENAPCFIHGVPKRECKNKH